MYEPDLISETKAAKLVGKKRPDDFFKTFVLNGYIEPIQYPGETRRRYIREEVLSLLDKFRLTLKEN